MSEVVKNNCSPFNNEEDRIRHVVAMHDYAKGLTETERDLAKEYSKTLLSYSGGALGISVTLVSGIFGSKLTDLQPTLYVSWAFLVLCIIFTMFSLRASQKSYRKESEDILTKILKQGYAIGPPAGRRWGLCAEFLEILAGIFFITGAAFLLIFVWCNLAV